MPRRTGSVLGPSCVLVIFKVREAGERFASTEQSWVLVAFELWEAGERSSLRGSTSSSPEENGEYRPIVGATDPRAVEGRFITRREALERWRIGFERLSRGCRERAPSNGPEHRAHGGCYRRVANDLGRLAAEALSKPLVVPRTVTFELRANVLRSVGRGRTIQPERIDN